MKRLQKVMHLGIALTATVLTAVPTYAYVYGIADEQEVRVISTDSQEGKYAVEVAGVVQYRDAEDVYIYKVKGQCIEDGAHIRKRPEADSGILKTLGVGVKVNVMERVGDWYKVALNDGTVGYMEGDQIEGACLDLLPMQEKDKVSEEGKVEVLDWEEADQLIPRGTVVTVQDVETGKRFEIKRTFGTNHADVEALSAEDTDVIKEIWGGFSWERRPVIVHIDGRRLAASLAGMPHAGDTLDAVPHNNMSGVMDLHFQGSRKHKEGGITATPDPLHQEAVAIAASYQG